MKNLWKNLLMILLICILIFVFYHAIFAKYRNKKKLEKDTISFSESIKNSPFSVSKIIFYSSAYGENQNTTFQQNSWILNILQYSDIAIYLEHTGESLNALNTVKKLSLENIQLSPSKLGTPSLYYLDSLNFGTANFKEQDKLDTSLEFTVLNDENANQEIQSNTPVFFTDCSNPITLKYVNSAVKENYAITSHDPIFFDGRLLKMANISLQDLTANLQFSIHVVNHNDQDFYYQISLPIYLENGNENIYDGNVLLEKTLENAKFRGNF